AGATYHALRQYAEAREMSKRVMALNPRSYWVRMLPGFQALDERADIRPLHSELAAIVAEEPGTAGKIADVLFRCALFERDPAAASRALAAIPAEGIVAGGNFVSPREWFAGVAARAFGDNSTAQASFSAARAIEEKIVHDQPDYAAAWSLLGRIDAALGRKNDAIREGRRACELMPVSQDAY